MPVTTPLSQALFWMNIYIALLAIQQTALHRIRALVATHSGPPDDYEPDVRLVETEIERVLVRLVYWEDMVDRANGALATAGGHR